MDIYVCTCECVKGFVCSKEMLILEALFPLSSMLYCASVYMFHSRPTEQKRDETVVVVTTVKDTSVDIRKHKNVDRITSLKPWFHSKNNHRLSNVGLVAASQISFNNETLKAIKSHCLRKSNIDQLVAGQFATTIF